MVGKADGRRADQPTSSAPGRIGLLWWILLPLVTTACGVFTSPEPPANQRYWHDVNEFVVFHWDASARARSYVVYLGSCEGQDTADDPQGCSGDRLGETRSTTAAVRVGNDLYPDDCASGNPCPTVNGIWVVACNRFRCSEHNPALTAQRLLSPDGTVPPTPKGFKGKKIVKGGSGIGPSDQASVQWDAVDGATHYELWVGSVPSSDFSLGLTKPGYGLRATRTDAKTHLIGAHETPTNAGFWGEYATTSWKVRACTKAGCSPFSKTVTIE